MRKLKRQVQKRDDEKKEKRPGEEEAEKGDDGALKCGEEIRGKEKAGKMMRGKIKRGGGGDNRR